jgi:hypothetical protein
LSLGTRDTSVPFGEKTDFGLVFFNIREPAPIIFCVPIFILSLIVEFTPKKLYLPMTEFPEITTCEEMKQ